MATRRALTGGTGDVNPQYLSFRVLQTAADTATTLQIALPIQRMATGGSQRAQVMEVLAVKYEASNIAGASATQTAHRYQVPRAEENWFYFAFTSSHSIQVFLSTRNPGSDLLSFEQPSVFSHYNKLRFGAWSTGGSAFIMEQEPYRDDLNDGAGHGYIVATDSIYVQIQSAATGVVNSCNGKIFYRWKNVGLQEYIGIVGGQQ